MAEEQGDLQARISEALTAMSKRCDSNGHWHFRKSRWWRRLYFWLGLPATVLAAISGATGLASTAGRIPAAIIALIAAGLGAAATFLDSDRRQRFHDGLAGAWFALGNEASLHLTLDVSNSYWIDSSAREVLRVLQARESDLLLGKLPVSDSVNDRPGPAVA